MKVFALLCVVSLLAGCSTSEEYQPIKNGDLYIGFGGTLSDQLSMDGSVRAIQASQIVGAGKQMTGSYAVDTWEGGYLNILLGYQVFKALDLEAAIYTNDGNAHQFSSVYSLYDPALDTPPFFGRRESEIYADLNDSGAMLSGLLNWRVNDIFQLFARFGGTYSQTDLTSTLRVHCVEACTQPEIFVNRVKYRTEGIRPVWGVGFTLSEIARFEYLVRRVPIGPTATEVTTASGASFDTATVGDTEPMHSFMITFRFGLKGLFGSDEESRTAEP